jgi:hypothetical protein
VFTSMCIFNNSTIGNWSSVSCSGCLKRILGCIGINAVIQSVASLCVQHEESEGCGVKFKKFYLCDDLSSKLDNIVNNYFYVFYTSGLKMTL